MIDFKGIRDRFGKYCRPDIYRRILPYFLPYKLSIFVVLAVAAVQSGLNLLAPWPMKVLIDNGLSGQRLPAWFDQFLPFELKTRLSVVIFAVVAGLGIKTIDYLLDVYGDYLKSIINGGVNLRFVADLFNHLMRLSFRYHDRTTVGDSIYRVSSDTDFVNAMGWNNFRYLLMSSIAFIGMLWILIRLDWKLALLALALSPLQYAAIGLYSKLFKAKSKQIKAMRSVSYSYIQEALSCLRVVKAFGQESREHRRVEDHNKGVLREQVRLGVRQGLFSLSLKLMGKMDRGLVLLVGAMHVLEGRLTIGGLLVILAYVDQLQGPLETIGDVLQNMQSSMVSAERVFEVLDVEPEIRDLPTARTLERVKGAIAFENVSFGYESGHPVLHNINVDVQPGAVIAIVGPTGAGKTTLASLIMRFYDPAVGRVTLDGHDLRDISLHSLRENIALVLQEAVLLSGTVRDNIAYGRPNATDDQITAAAEAANAHCFITALPERYDTQVGERGVRLSGGERQRLAIARAFLKDAPVLILDEPTSSVDARTEAVILDALDRLIAGRTTFVIAHRLSTIRSADQILILDHGRIAEQGVHNDLLLRDGIYAEIFRIQSGALGKDRKIEAV